MHAPTISKKAKTSSLTKLQATFERHCRKISQLRTQLERVKKEYEEALVLYHSDLKHKEKKAADLVTQFILKSNDLTKDPKALNKKEKKTFKEMIKESVNMIFHLLDPRDIHDKIKSLYKEFNGKSYENEFHEEISLLKEMFKKNESFNHIDLSNLNPNDSCEDIMIKLSDIFNRIAEHEELPPSHPRQKSKMELLKEKKALELEALQNKSLNNIYKRLVKELHPDLEQDPKNRAEKESLMKRLTVANENNDLISLLAIETEWLGDVASDSDRLSEESLKVYNSLLKDQIEDLNMELSIVWLAPRYIDICYIIENSPQKPLKGIVDALSECDELIVKYDSMLKDISGGNPLQQLKIGLAIRARQFRIDDLPLDLNFLMSLELDVDDISDDIENEFFKPDKKPKKRKI
jgi:hypothetical protein